MNQLHREIRRSYRYGNIALATWVLAAVLFGALLVLFSLTGCKAKGQTAQIANTNASQVFKAYVITNAPFDIEDIRDMQDERWIEPKAFCRTNVVIYWKGEYRIYRMVDWLKYGEKAQHVWTTNTKNLHESLRPYHP